MLFLCIIIDKFVSSEQKSQIFSNFLNPITSIEKGEFHDR